MRFTVLTSGSSGNAAYVETGDFGLLLDAGISVRRLAILLNRVGRRIEDVGAVLLTHGHADHAAGVGALARVCGIPIYASQEVALAAGCQGVLGVDPHQPFEAGPFRGVFFEVSHDTPTCGLRLSNGGSSTAFATDLGEVGPETFEELRGADAVMLEANHDYDWLRTGPYPAELKRRIASPRGHLSNRQAAKAAIGLAPYGLKDLVLAHLSEINNSPARACGTVRNALLEVGYGGIRVRAAIKNHPTPWIEVGTPPDTGEYVYRYREAAGSLFEVE